MVKRKAKEKKPEKKGPIDPYTGEVEPAAEDAYKITEIIPTDPDNREGENFLMEEEDSLDKYILDSNADEIAEQRLRHAELDVGIDVGIVGVVDLRDQDLEARLEDQRMQMRRPHGVAILCLQQAADHAVRRDGIADHHHRAEPEAAVGVGREFAAQVHLGLFGILVLVETHRRGVPDIDLGALDRAT